MKNKILKLIDKEAKRQYNEFVKVTKIKLQPNGWKDWKIDRIKLKKVIEDLQ